MGEKVLARLFAMVSAAIAGSGMIIFLIPFLLIVAFVAFLAMILGPIFTLITGHSIDIPSDVDREADQQAESQIGPLGMTGTLQAYYQGAQQQYQVPWALVAAVHYKESGFGGKVTPNSDNKVGEQLTDDAHLSSFNLRRKIWVGPKYTPYKQQGVEYFPAKRISDAGGYGVDADQDSYANPKQTWDAVFTAARYMQVKGIALNQSDEQLRKHLIAYYKDNRDGTDLQAQEYAQDVLYYYHEIEKQASDANSYTIRPIDSGVVDVPGYGNGSDPVADIPTDINPPENLSWPTPFTRTITSPFGYRIHPIKKTRRLHTGVDIAAPGIAGKPAAAVADGKVVFAGQMGGYGNTVVIDVGGGISVLYGHLQKILVSKGTAVRNGQTVGLIGSTGWSTGPHLHFEVRIRGTPVDPMPYLTGKVGFPGNEQTDKPKQPSQKPGKPSGETKPPAKSNPPPSSSAQKRRTEQITSVFENGTTEIQYDYVEYLNDGRGYTSGKAGFTTGTGDAYEVVRQYTNRIPDNPLARFLPELKRLISATDPDDISGLDGYEKAWKQAAKDPQFLAAQDTVTDQMYYNPALKHAERVGVTTALGKAIFYDSIIQHGEGNDPDGFPALIEKTSNKANGTPKSGVNEKEWVTMFLTVRQDVLSHAHNPDTRDEWSRSVGRVRSLMQIVKSGNFDLNVPFTFEWENKPYTIQ